MRPFVLWMALKVLAWGDPRCIQCHQALVDDYSKTPKAQSITKPRAEVQLQRTWIHDISARRLGVAWQSGKLFHFIEEKNRQASYETLWAVGSGRHAKNYLVAVNDSLFFSPIAWYSERLIWDMAPGYHVDGQPDFYRGATRDCLQCHAGSLHPIPGTVNRYGDPAIAQPAIGCARCHGDPAVHLADPKRGNIVNPSRLDAARRDSVCESCHLMGEARVLNPGRNYTDFIPGMRMEEVFTAYVSKKSADDTVLRAWNEVEQLAMSRCATESGGKLWCGTCHDSHRRIPERQKALHYRDRCQTCHRGEAAETHKSRYGDDCAQCHMLKIKPYDGSHTAITDHWIRKRERENRFIDRGEFMRAWREPAEEIATRNLAIAYITSSERNRSLRRYREGIDHLNRAIAEGHKDADFAAIAGTQFLRQKAPDKAIPWFAQTVSQEPRSSLRRLQLAAALATAGHKDEARQEALEAIRLEPLLAEAYALLAEIDPGRAASYREQYRKLVPKRLIP
jgi:hypothetical protein